MIADLSAHLWQSTSFALAAGLLTLAFRNNRAQVRFWLWLSASVKFLLPFAVLIGAGTRIQSQPAVRSIVTPEFSVTVERLAGQVSFVNSVPVPTPTNWLPAVGVAVWLCGFAVIALMRLRQWLRVRAALRASTLLEIPCAVEIRSSPGLLEPGVVGLLRPVLLLPEGIQERLTGSQLEAVLAHELCHVRRRDNLFAALHMIVEAVFWFHPLVWWIGARMVDERERACDEGVLGLGNQPRIYADAIVKVCEMYVESPLVCVAGVTGANLKRRIENIMTNRTAYGLNGGKKLLLAVTGVAALAGPVVVGVMIGVGNAPAIHAQVPVPAAPLVEATPQRSNPSAPPLPFADRRLVAMLFDLGTMTADDQARARQTAINFVQTKMQPADIVSVMTVNNNGSIQIVHDFTEDTSTLVADISQLTAGANTSTSQLSTIETASRILSVFPQKKALMYFSSGVPAPPAGDQQLQHAIAAAQQANIAIYAIDVRSGDTRGVVPSLSTPPKAAIQPEEQRRRLAYVRDNFGSISSAMARTYIRYGAPDQIEDRGAGTQIWRYNYLDNFHSRAEFEFAPGRSERINWPPPLATHDATSGLPGRHASFQIYPAGESQILSVPLEALSGQVHFLARIRTAGGAAVANVEDTVQASTGQYQAAFTLQSGAYTCNLIVKELATGQTYQETINFDIQ